jgi:hypothetical protein
MEFSTSDGNQVAVCGDTSNLDQYMKVFNSPATAEAMAFDGIKRETVKVFVLDKELNLEVLPVVPSPRHPSRPLRGHRPDRRRRYGRGVPGDRHQPRA